MLICTECGKTFSDKDRVWRCTCGGTLRLTAYKVSKDLDGGARDWFHLNFQNKRVFLSFGEENTPLAMRDVGLDGKRYMLFFKLDYTMASGSYKDRGMSILVSWLRIAGVKHVIEDSSGNAGASMAAYCASAGIPCDVYVPEYTSEGKCVQIQAYGANIVRVPGSREDTTKAAIEAAESNKKKFYASHNWSPFFMHGVKFWAYEILRFFDQFEKLRVINLIVPVGQGSIALGTYLAIQDFQGLGRLKNKQVKIWAVQPEGCAPLAKAWEARLSAPVAIEKQETAAEGIASANPVRGAEVLAAVLETQGGFVTVSEDEIWSALQDLCHIGLYVEPTSAAAMAGWQKLVRTKRIRPDLDLRLEHELTVVYLSGSGLKATDKILKHNFGTSLQ